MFDILNKILYKTKNVNVENINENEDFVPFMIQRWCSMHSPEIAVLLNETSNRQWNALQDKEDWYNYLNTVVPPCRFKSYKYLKKKKEETKIKNKEGVGKVASALEISSREVNLYIQQFKLEIPNEQHQKR